MNPPLGPSFPKIEAVSKKARVLGALRDAILSGAIPRGDQIVEHRLAHQFGVGQGLIREALIELEHEGLVERTPFSSTSVPALTLDDAQQIFEMRIDLEPLTFRLAARNAQAEDLVELRELGDKTKIAFDGQDLDGFFKSHLNFRKKIWQLSGNKYAQQALERVVVPLYALYLIGGSHEPDGLAECLEHQDNVLEALRLKDPDLAGREAHRFLSKTKQYLGTRLVPQE
jgi:DNA-binding GntR family transcriptional regulator